MEQDHAASQARGGFLGPGAVVDGRFRLASVVARAGSDAVYCALDERSRQRVRLRVTAHPPDPALLKLRHPGFPAVVHHGRSGRWHYVALEWFDGEPAQLPAGGPLDPERVRAWARAAMDLLDALEHAHVTAGRAHGSLCLASLWEARDRGLRVIDVTAPDGPLAEEIVPYASPERLRGLPRDVRSDLYSVACVFYALAAGSPPFGTDPIEARSGHLLRRPADPPLPPMFVAVLRTALEKQPHHRFASAARMRAALGLAIRDFDAGTPNPAVLDTVVPTDGVALAVLSPDEETESVLTWAPVVADDEAVLDEVAPLDTLRPAAERAAAPQSEVTTAVPADGGMAPVPVPVPAGAPAPPSGLSEAERETLVVSRSAHLEAARAVPARRPVRRRAGARPLWAVAAVLVAGIVASIAAWVTFAAGLAVLAAWRQAAPGGSPAPIPVARADDPAPAPATARVEQAPDATGDGDGATDAAAPSSEGSAADPEAEPGAEAGDDVAVAPSLEPTTVPVDFPYDAYRPVERATFPEFVSLVSRHPGQVLLTGHTDDRGPAEANQVLGLGRAWAVQQLLRFRGIEEQKVPIASKGETEPIADNSTPEGRAANRRVTAEFLDEAPETAPGTP